MISRHHNTADVMRDVGETFHPRAARSGMKMVGTAALPEQHGKCHEPRAAHSTNILAPLAVDATPSSRSLVVEVSLSTIYIRMPSTALASEQ